MVYPVKSTKAHSIIPAFEKWIQPFEILLPIIHDRGPAFINIEFNNWTKELGFTLRQKTAYSPWTNGKIETQNLHKARYWRKPLNNPCSSWSSSAPKFAVDHNTKVADTTEKTPYEIVFGGKPQVHKRLLPEQTQYLLFWLLQRHICTFSQRKIKESALRQTFPTTVIS